MDACLIYFSANRFCTLRAAMKRISWHMKRNQFQHSIYRLSWPRMRNSWIWYPFPSYCVRILLYLHALIRDAKQRDTRASSASLPALHRNPNSNRKNNSGNVIVEAKLNSSARAYIGRILPIQLIGTPDEKERKRKTGSAAPFGRAIPKLGSRDVLSPFSTRVRKALTCR